MDGTVEPTGSARRVRARTIVAYDRGVGVMLITGASRGIGAATALLAAAEGYAVAVNYARDFVAPNLKRRSPVGHEIDALKELDAALAAMDPDTPADTIQHEVFEIGKRHPFESLRHWFQALYETLLGSSQGPRMGSFFALYGIENSRKLIAEAIQDSD